MPNTNPSDCDCTALCTSCGCSECGRKSDPDTRGPLTLVSGRVVQACAECRAAAADSDGVPIVVDSERTKPEYMTMEDVADYWAAMRLTGGAR